MGYEYGNARVAAMRGRLLGLAAIRRLGDSATTSVMVTQLERSPDWAPILRRVAPLGTEASMALETAVEFEANGASSVLAHAVDFFVIPSGDEIVTSGVVFLGSIDSLLGDSMPDASGRMAVVTTPPSMGMEILLAAKAAAEADASGLILILDPMVPADVIPMVAGQIEASGLPPQPR